MELHAFRGEAREEGGGEVKTCRRRRHRAPGRRVDGLVALAILGLGRFVPFDVGRQRRQPVALEQLVNFPRRGDLHHPRSVRAVLAHDGLRGAAGQRDAYACPAALPRAHEGLPPPAVERAQHEELRRPPGAVQRAEEPGGNDPALVHHHAVSRLEPAGKIGEVRVLEGAPGPVEHEELRGITRLRGLLGDALRGQVIVEERYVHGV
jgi:hypothetical protein